MTDRVIKEYDRLLKRTKRSMHYGRRMKRQMKRLFRMNKWDIDHDKKNE